MSPLPVDNLTPDSEMGIIREAINQSIEQCMNEPTPEGEDIPNKQKWCAGKAFGIARERTGKSMMPAGGQPEGMGEEEMMS